ncbi:MAG: hypothetical protein KKA65_05945 [Nanoarchaeota archaeon]|nr:hypothetical protein [Nanoarchaeota archaeon]
MKSIQEMTQGELGAFVQSYLRKKRIEVVLSGGAAVSIESRLESAVQFEVRKYPQT